MKSIGIAISLLLVGCVVPPKEQDCDRDGRYSLQATELWGNCGPIILGLIDLDFETHPGECVPGDEYLWVSTFDGINMIVLDCIAIGDGSHGNLDCRMTVSGTCYSEYDVIAK